MDRTKFYNVETVDGVQELDFLHNSLSALVLQYQPGYYMVTQADIGRPTNISYKNYNTIKYWWAIMVVNGIRDPLNDLQVGQILQIPDLKDLYEFYKSDRLR